MFEPQVPKDRIGDGSGGVLPGMANFARFARPADGLDVPGSKERERFDRIMAHAAESGERRRDAEAERLAVAVRDALAPLIEDANRRADERADRIIEAIREAVRKD